MNTQMLNPADSSYSSMLHKKPTKVNNLTYGIIDSKCDNCGKALGKRKWLYWESTGCSRQCVVENHNHDMESF